ncbi:uncharacterized protein LY89DRAFT_759694 [Mollisia scopiformis]|uniref:Uncharacterized protein n=1 Tax=Mollisia scopiformis TaxID=149040 RepID=A0A194WS65_MOLSC|nr:uncharacterized protein LY89DRAFT_759694 [Mollisia scopiformis]KUJ10813.1 hypothetical protein LY89DRAFT_759694 [Mollisia scopiformis]
MQGGYFTNPLEPDMSAANNRFDPIAAAQFHIWLEEKHIKSTVYTKVAAFATPLTTELFHALSATSHVLGTHLLDTQQAQDIQFYRDAVTGTGGFMTPEFFLRNKTSWFDTHDAGDTYPDAAGNEIVLYLTKVVAYDALAALGAAGQDVLVEWGVKKSSRELHEVVGTAGPLGSAGIDGKKMARALRALLRVGLLTSLP